MALYRQGKPDEARALIGKDYGPKCACVPCQNRRAYYQRYYQKHKARLDAMGLEARDRLRRKQGVPQRATSHRPWSELR